MSLPPRGASEAVLSLWAGLVDEVDRNKAKRFVLEHHFCDSRRWRSDFAFPEYRLLIEVEGGIHSQGRHTRGKGFERDCEKYNEAAILGWTVLRFPSRWCLDGRALDTFRRWVAMRAP